MGHTRVISCFCPSPPPLSPGWIWLTSHCTMPAPTLDNPWVAIPPQDMNDRLPASSVFQVSHSFSDRAFSKSKIRAQSLFCWVGVGVVKFWYEKILHVREVGTIFLCSKKDTFLLGEGTAGGERCWFQTLFNSGFLEGHGGLGNVVQLFYVLEKFLCGRSAF